jgi:hypothetical protein
MDTNIEMVRHKLADIQDEVRRGAFRSRHVDRDNGWGGAGVIFSRERLAATAGAVKGFYPETKYVTTAHAGEAGWLLNRLRDIFSDAGLIDSCSKIEFFGRLANAALRYQEQAKKKETDTLLLAAMLAEAKVMLGEMEKGKFECFMVVPGGVIVDDLMKR